MGKMEPTYVDVICQHTKDGDIIPMRVRVTDESGIYQAYSIKQYRIVSKDGAYTTPDGILVCNNAMTNIHPFTPCSPFVDLPARPIKFFKDTFIVYTRLLRYKSQSS